ncbi:hypothetical protein [Actinacidiphila sp. ITFR-21]|uniref:hypothetical protein n=1 Tax=Actinacidiphila sp. ITFR-21 TaxID=3075199 RepID=UPI00288B8239|nr:hypothetical protein [Streptomyces sp. ITFR-21]WNI15231.1 hypothetical protein RLT57_06560 [Streptomyces sp. ITFR-21]
MTTTWDPIERKRLFDEWLASLTPADYVREVLLDNARDSLLDGLCELGDGAPDVAMQETVGGDCGTVRFTLTLEVVPTGLTMAEVEARWDAEEAAESAARGLPSPALESAPSGVVESAPDRP